MKNVLMISILSLAIQLFAAEDVVNLVPDLLKGKGELRKEKKSTEEVQLKLDNETLKISMDNEDSILFLRSPAVKIEPGKKYLLSLDMKVANLKFSNSKSYLMVYLYNTANNAHSWFRVVGGGNMDWFTILLPFEADSILKKSKTMPNILLRFLHLTGKFEIKNISVSEIPQNADLKRGVVTADGKNIAGATFRLNQAE